MLAPFQPVLTHVERNVKALLRPGAAALVHPLEALNQNEGDAARTALLGVIDESVAKLRVDLDFCANTALLNIAVR